MNMTLLKPGGGSAKNKISGAFNIAVRKILPGMRNAGEEYILEAQKTAIEKTDPVPQHLHCYGLPRRKAGIILKAQVDGREIICRLPERSGSIGIDGIAPRAQLSCMVI